MKLLSLASRFAPELLCFDQPAETQNRVALTFDDGPHPEYTPRILEILGKLEVRATFFFQGLNAARWPELVHPFASAIDSPLPPAPERTHLMLGSKAAWVEPAIGPGDQEFAGYPDEAIAEWHERLGLVDDD